MGPAPPQDPPTLPGVLLPQPPRPALNEISTRNLVLTGMLMMFVGGCLYFSHDAKLAGALALSIVTLWMHSGRSPAVPAVPELPPPPSSTP